MSVICIGGLLARASSLLRFWDSLHAIWWRWTRPEPRCGAGWEGSGVAVVCGCVSFFFVLGVAVRVGLIAATAAASTATSAASTATSAAAADWFSAGVDLWV